MGFGITDDPIRIKGESHLWSRLNSSELRVAYWAGLSRNSPRAQACRSRLSSVWKLDSGHAYQTKRAGNCGEQLRQPE
jgi:hypothetical protein